MREGTYCDLKFQIGDLGMPSLTVGLPTRSIQKLIRLDNFSGNRRRGDDVG